MAAHLAHYQETRFESYGCNQRSVGVSPFSKMPDSVNTDFVSFNYHFLLAELSLVTAWSVCGFAANALQEGEVKLTNRLVTPMTYK